jgi:hypothetical protein
MYNFFRDDTCRQKVKILDASCLKCSKNTCMQYASGDGTSSKRHLHVGYVGSRDGTRNRRRNYRIGETIDKEGRVV